eukprot:TRINITY_DN67975_c1_g2_i7.p1 TRINITY_DN67975_c1_g2~~TRINITY_DN67975_c1_g2_i7.p1  ORF type:complete len:372 (-),score=43.92 TRINITY_DN67975_c1_g2_i7:48-1163(-)
MEFTETNENGASFVRTSVCMAVIPPEVLVTFFLPYLDPVHLTQASGVCNAWRSAVHETVNWWVLWNAKEIEKETRWSWWRFPSWPFSRATTHNMRKIALPFPESVQHSVIHDFLRKKSFPQRVKVSLNRYGIDFDGRPITEQDLRDVQYSKSWRFFNLEWHMNLKKHAEEYDDEKKPGWENDVFGWDDELAALSYPNPAGGGATQFPVSRSNDVDYALRPTSSPEFNGAFDRTDTSAVDPWMGSSDTGRIVTDGAFEWNQFFVDLTQYLHIYKGDWRARYTKDHSLLVQPTEEDVRLLKTAQENGDDTTIQQLGEKYFPSSIRVDTPELHKMDELDLQNAEAALPSNYYTGYGLWSQMGGRPGMKKQAGGE